MIAPTSFSLPGMVREEKITRSPFASVTSGCSFRAIRARAARGSPWLPVSRGHDLVRRQIAVRVDGAERRQAGQHAHLAGDLNDAVHGAPDADHLAAAGGRGLGDGAHARPRSRRRS